jgi:hypothetical protein
LPVKLRNVRPTVPEPVHVPPMRPWGSPNSTTLIESKFADWVDVPPP